MDEKESRTRKKLTRSDKESKTADKPESKKTDAKKADKPDIKKADKPDIKKADKLDPKKTDKHKYPLTHVPSTSFVSMYVSKECENLLWGSIRSRH
jgi:hypothetical protein